MISDFIESLAVNNEKNRIVITVMDHFKMGNCNSENYILVDGTKESFPEQSINPEELILGYLIRSDRDFYKFRSQFVVSELNKKLVNNAYYPYKKSVSCSVSYDIDYETIASRISPAILPHSHLEVYFLRELGIVALKEVYHL